MEYIQAMYSTITLSATFRLSAPLLLGLAGYCFSNKAGIMNIALESFMMISAFFALLGSYLFHSAFIGALFGVVAGTVLSFLYGVLVFHAGANGLITGVGFNLSGWGLTTMLLVAIFHTRGATNVGAVSFSPIDVPILRDIPYLGKIFNQQTILVYLGPLLMLVAWVVMYKTPFGVRIRAVGLNQRAAETAGVSVMKYSWIAMLLSGACMGLSGTFISLNSLAMFSENMTAGAALCAGLGDGGGGQSAQGNALRLHLRLLRRADPDLVRFRRLQPGHQYAALSGGAGGAVPHPPEKHQKLWAL